MGKAYAVAEVSPPDPRMRAKNVLKWFVAMALVGYLVVSLSGQWKELLSYRWNVEVGTLVLAVAVGVAANFILIVIWHQLLRDLGTKVPYAATYRVWWRSALFRYLPGKILGVATMIYLGEKEGISKGRCLTSGAINQVFSLLSGFSLGACFLLLRPSEEIQTHSVLLALALLVTVLVGSSAMVPRVVNPILERRGWAPIEWSLGLGRSVYFFAVYCLYWSAVGLGFFLLVQSTTSIDWRLLPELVAVYVIAYLAGFLVLITPGGLGAREAVLTALLLPYLPEPMAILIALVSRVWMTAAELISVGIGYGWRS